MEIQVFVPVTHAVSICGPTNVTACEKVEWGTLHIRFSEHWSSGYRARMNC